jgi:hypothetical protein
MNETIECAACGYQDGKLHLDRGVVLHPDDRACQLPPRVKTPELKPPRYPSPYRAPRLVGRDASPSRWFE